MYYSSRFHSGPNRMASNPPSSSGSSMTARQVNNAAYTAQRCNTIGQDFGPNPYVVNISDSALGNTNFRKTLWTGNHLQLTQMSIGPGGEIGLEMHPDTDQFLRLEQGKGRVMMGDNANSLGYQRDVAEDHAVFVPAGTWHNMVNTGNEPVKLYSIYAPSHHPAGTIHCTKQDSDEAEG